MREFGGTGIWIQWRNLALEADSQNSCCLLLTSVHSSRIILHILSPGIHVYMSKKSMHSSCINFRIDRRSNKVQHEKINILLCCNI
jgi:hypothetical protein